MEIDIVALPLHWQISIHPYNVSAYAAKINFLDSADVLDHILEFSGAYSNGKVALCPALF